MMLRTIAASEIPVGTEVWFTTDEQTRACCATDGRGIVAARGKDCLFVRAGRTQAGTDIYLRVAEARVYAAWQPGSWPRVAVVADQAAAFPTLDRPAAASPRLWFRARRRHAARSTEARGEHKQRTGLMEVGGPDPQMEGQ